MVKFNLEQALEVIKCSNGVMQCDGYSIYCCNHIYILEINKEMFFTNIKEILNMKQNEWTINKHLRASDNPKHIDEMFELIKKRDV